MVQWQNEDQDGPYISEHRATDEGEIDNDKNHHGQLRPNGETDLRGSIGREWPKCEHLEHKALIQSQISLSLGSPLECEL